MNVFLRFTNMNFDTRLKSFQMTMTLFIKSTITKQRIFPRFWRIIFENLEDEVQTVEHSFKAIVTEFSSIEFENNEIIGLKTDSLDLQHASNSRLSTESNQGLSL